MMLEEIMGRYEYICHEENSRKYWHIFYDRTSGNCYASWGRIGTNLQQHKKYSLKEAEKKVKEKTKKGYRKVGGYDTEIGSNALNYFQE